MVFDPISKTWCVPNDRPIFMGIVNCTPDSFSDGVGARDLSAAYFIEKALALVEEGAELLDIGGESTRPGADVVSLDIELKRVLPVIEGVRKQSTVPLSIDTRKAEVARQALATGASIVNDVSGFHFDAALMQALIADCAPGVILVHSRGTPQTMQEPPHAVYQDVAREVVSELKLGIKRLCAWGSRPNCICIDPGFGFAKRPEHSWELLHQLTRLRELPHPVLIGLSRKGFLGERSGEPVAARRDPETLAALAIAYNQGFQLFRVHRVAYCRKFFAVYTARKQ